MLQVAMQEAGLPSDTLDTQVMTIYTLGNLVDVGPPRPPVSTFLPQPLDVAVLRAELRAFAVDELAQLPDFSWSLADWASGNETCPIPELAGQPAKLSGAIACHDFPTHMGALNASHFPPESERWFGYMHQLALQRADQCRIQRATAYTKAVERTDATRARALDARWLPIWRECETEVLALEAVAQHYLQDSWSSGHMWQRWGSSTLENFELPKSTDPKWNSPSASDALRRLIVAEMVAINAGTIHGSDPVSYEKFPAWLHPTVLGDAICYPRSAALSALMAPDATQRAVAGDMHVHELLGDTRTQALFGLSREQLHNKLSSRFFSVTPVNDLEEQGKRMLQCASGSVRQVYDRLADKATYGAQAFGAPSSDAAPPPPDSRCNAPRVNNATFAQGFEPTLLKPTLGEWLAGLPIDNIPSDIENQSTLDYLKNRGIALALASARPNGTEGANLVHPAFTWTETVCPPRAPCRTVTHSEVAETMTLLGVKPNGHYSSPPTGTQPAPHADPPLPWGNADEPSKLGSGTPEQYLASTFHRAHAPFWCSRFTVPKLLELRERVSTATTEAARSTACGVCVEVTSRHMRVAGQPALCELVRPGSATVVSEEGNDPHSAAEDLCGCDLNLGVLSNDGFRVLSENLSTGDVSVRHGPVEVGRIPRDATVATRGRVFLTNSDGQVVGLRVSSTGLQELDLDPATSATRAYVGSDVRAIAFTEQKGHDWLFVVDGATDTLHTFDLGTEHDERFKVCSVLDVGRDVVRAEGAWDIAVTADGTRGFVSLRGPLNNPGDAIALVDLMEATTCMGPYRPITHVSGFGGGSGLGALALSPDETLLAVAGRRRAMCLDRVYTNAAGTSVEDVQVGCDDVWVLRVSQLAAGPLPSSALYTFGARNTLPTRPASYPYAVAWHPSGAKLAFANFSGPPDTWPRYAPLSPGGTVSLGSISPAYWSYNVALDGNVIGETAEFSQDGSRLYVGTGAGTLFVMPGPGEFWDDREADPETYLHAVSALFGSWYGGCFYDGPCPGGRCPANCPRGAELQVKKFPVGSPIRKLLRL
ncbi:Hypothetical protein AA314_02823 [Archangium gephyra]|uniref:Uncharacterized protein n=1 Tax=Archangium gephyra TaxID=48 RepID=A0AAC8TCV4_9BACT|nr:Hypothetical protein AA314_02823 [Archangium gephyra]